MNRQAVWQSIAGRFLYVGIACTVACTPLRQQPYMDIPREPEVVIGGGAAAQDVDGVRATLRAYFTGHATGRADVLQQAFHPAAQMVVLRDGQVRAVPIAEYIAGFSGRAAPDETERRRWIGRIEIMGTTAVARVELDYPAVHHTDFMTLLREGDRWLIIGKTAHSVRRAAPAVAPPSGTPR